MIYKHIKTVSYILLLAILAFIAACSDSEKEDLQHAQVDESVSLTRDLSSSNLLATPSQIEQQQNPIVASEDESLHSNTPIFFTVRNEAEHVVEIWQTSADATVQWQLLTLPIRYPVSALPAQELAALNHNHCANQQDDCPTELIYSLNNLALSPNKQFLSWIDGASWCPNTTCYGFERLMVWDLSKGDLQTLLEIPFHIDLRSTQAIVESTWSPDSREIGLVISSHEYGWSLVRTVDVETKQVRDISEGMAPIAWSPNGDRLAVTIRTTDRDWAVKVVTNDGETLTTFAANWKRVMGVDWSPDASKLAITALVEQQLNGDSLINSGLFIVDVNTEEVTRVDLLSGEGLSYSEPHWSPDGRLLGVIIAGTDHDKSLVIFDPQDRAIEASFAPKLAFNEWLWSRTGDAILVLVGGDLVDSVPFPPARIGVFYWQDDSFEIISLPSQLEKKVKEWTAYLDNLTW